MNVGGPAAFFTDHDQPPTVRIDPRPDLAFTGATAAMAAVALVGHMTDVPAQDPWMILGMRWGPAVSQQLQQPLRSSQQHRPGTTHRTLKYPKLSLIIAHHSERL